MTDESIKTEDVKANPDPVEYRVKVLEMAVFGAEDGPDPVRVFLYGFIVGALWVLISHRFNG